ncbi:hypothetical protein OROMI_033419 [Orobanche minor]
MLKAHEKARFFQKSRRHFRRVQSIDLIPCKEAQGRSKKTWLEVLHKVERLDEDLAER